MSHGQSFTVENCHSGQIFGGRMVWVGMSRGRIVGGRNIKAPYKPIWEKKNADFNADFRCKKYFRKSVPEKS
jgi:hypothetical protein